MNFELKIFTKIVALIFISVFVLFLFSLGLDYLFLSGGNLGAQSLWILMIAFLFLPVVIMYKDELSIDNTNLLLRKYTLWIMVFIISFIVMVYLVENNGFERLLSRGFAYTVDDFVETVKDHFSYYGLVVIFHYKVMFTITSYAKYRDRSLGILIGVIYGALLIVAGPYMFYAFIFNGYNDNSNMLILLGVVAGLTGAIDHNIYKSL